MKIHNSKTFLQDKIDRYNSQGGLCCICKRELNSDITSNHLDHDHDLDGLNAGRIRGLLCNLCNSLEGQVKHKFDRSGLKSKDIDMFVWVQSLVDYWNLDNSNAYIHPKYIPDKVKQFNRLSKDEMIAELHKIGLVYDIKDTKADLVKKYRKQLRINLK